MDKRFIILFILVVIYAQSSVSVAANSYGTWFQEKGLRIDYLHRGTFSSEELIFERFIEERYWGGSQVHLLDTFGYGDYYLEVVDSVSGAVIYSRGYSTLFPEWQSTAMAVNDTGVFKEALVIPFPHVPVFIEIFRRNKQQHLESVFRVYFNKEEHTPEVQAPLSYPVFDIMVTGPVSERLDILFIAEGYRESEREKFYQDCSRFAGYLIGASPFRDYRTRINIRGMMTYSEDSITRKVGNDKVLNTAIGVSFNTFGSDRYLMAGNFQRVRDVAALAPNDQIVILVNSADYGGGGIFNYYATATSDHRASDFLLLHEFGHSFAGLADEYYTSEVAYQDYYDLDTEPREPNITTLADFNSKWLDMMDGGTPIPTPMEDTYRKIVGVYEGGGYTATGIYRPFQDCTMKSVLYDGFCPVCQRAIMRMLNFYGQ